MSNKNRNKRVGQGMKPRPQQTEAIGEVKPVELTGDPSVATGQGEGQNEAFAGVQETVETGGRLEGDSVQNLDSDKTAGVAADTLSEPPKVPKEAFDALAAMMGKANEDSGAPAQTFGETGPGMNSETGCISNEALAKRPTIAELEQAMNQGKIELLPDGKALFGPIVGQRSDGTFGLVITIPEGLIEPIRQQAEADGVTPEEWVSTRTNEYLESWWSAPKGR